LLPDGRQANAATGKTPATTGRAIARTGGIEKLADVQTSQWTAARGCASPPEAGTASTRAWMLQTPPSLPVRTSSASSKVGAINAETSASKLSQTPNCDDARRAHANGEANFVE
jgi:hypothetical protein